MAVEFKDYYKILGVPRTASADDIRKAFRKLAREYHPDVAKNKAQAEEKFKEINEANEVLSDPDKRKKYDLLGAQWKSGPPPSSGGGFRRGPGGHAYETGESFEFGGTGFSDFFEQFFGGAQGGGGFSRGGFEQATAKGQDVEAEILVTLEEATHGSIRPISLRRNVVCPKCRGSGMTGQRACPECGGTGYQQKNESYKVKIPVGVSEGQRLRLAGHGEPASGGGESGDLLLRVRFAGHPEFKVEENHLVHELDLAPWEAALGGNVQVPTLSAPVSIKIPAGTQGGQRLRIKERGLPGRDGQKGDLYVVTKIQMPKEISEKERELWKSLSDASHFKPRE